MNQIKRFFPTGLALLLVMGSLGHVFAAAFCPRMLGHDCCLTKKSSQQRSSQSHHHGMAMDGMSDESMKMDDVGMHDMMMDDAVIPSTSAGMHEATLLPGSEELVSANKLELPIEACTHCMSHSGVLNAPISSVSAPDQSNKDFGSVPSRVARLFATSAMTPRQIGLPREHAPPGSSAPRHLLINVFQI